MRNIINISLPQELVREVEREVKKGKFASKSEYFRHLVREQKLASELRKEQKEVLAGKGSILRSLRDLR